MTPDIINGLFEFVGAAFIWLSIRRLYTDKKVAGVSWIHVSFFTAWGAWNIFYYPHLGQMWSLAGGIAVVVSNIVWLAGLLYYPKA